MGKHKKHKKHKKQEKRLRYWAKRLDMTPKELGDRIMDSHARIHGYGKYEGQAAKDQEPMRMGFIK
jgi:hypothetical protein